jgi:hypothetical protein
MRRPFDLIADWVAPVWALRWIGRVELIREDGHPAKTDPRLGCIDQTVLGVPVRKNEYVPDGQVIDLTDPVDGERRVFVSPDDGVRIFGGFRRWRGAPWARWTPSNLPVV